MNIVLSSGHAKYCRGAADIIDEVDEARKVVPKVAEFLVKAGVGVSTFHDDESHSQSENLNRIVNYHNKQKRDLDVSIHFNAYEHTGAPMGTECLYVTQSALAQKVADRMSAVSGLKNRGPKKRDDLFFLNNTGEPAVLIEVCFVDSQADVDIYRKSLDAICAAIAEALSGVELPNQPDPPDPTSEPAPEPPSGVLFSAIGKASTFGGPDDTGVSPSEGLAIVMKVEDKPELFLPFQPPDTIGLARRLNPYVHYLACRWDYEVTPKTTLLHGTALVRATKTGITLKAFPADWGPHQDTGRVADLSPSLMSDLGIKTDDEVVVTFPA